VNKAHKENLSIPWDDDAPNPNLVEFCETNTINGRGRTALKIGCGLGHDAEFLQSLGFKVTGFDLSPSAIASARIKFPDSEVN
jgi:2-polyprenyl-3-methyl-5-hydroxy-6-metoxy-1,4-benzoquinol methylase